MTLKPHSVETPVERVLGALRTHGEQPKLNGKGYVSRCPAHEDSTPSLSISEGRDGSCLVHCHANCDPERILNELNLQWEDMFPPKPDEGRRELARYPYVDEDSHALFEVVRGVDHLGKKTFRQEPANGRRGPGSMKGTRLVLYRLDRVTIAAANGETIYVVEGEKDVESIERTHPEIVATCNPMGAGKWRDEYAQSLKGARVVISADRDDAGRAHARVVARSLDMLGIEYDLLEPASGKDVTDHLAEGLTLDQLVPISDGQVEVEEEVPSYDFNIETWEEFRDHTEEEVDYLVEGLVGRGSLVFVASEPKAGKTWLSLALALSVATGKPYLDRFDVLTPEPVLYLALEGLRTDYRTRLGGLARGQETNPDVVVGNLHMSYQPLGLDLMDKGWSDKLKSEVARLDVKVVFVDVLRDGAPRLREDGQGSGDFAIIKRHLKPLLKAGVTIVLVHHFVKRNESNRKRTIGEMMSGSGSLYGAADLVIGITTNAKEWENMRVDFVGRLPSIPQPFRVQATGNRNGKYGGFGYRDAISLITAAEDAEKSKPTWLFAEKIAAWIKEQDRLVSVGEISKRFEVATSTINDNDDDLEKYGITHLINYENKRLSGYQATNRTNR